MSAASHPSGRSDGDLARAATVASDGGLPILELGTGDRADARGAGAAGERTLGADVPGGDLAHAQTLGSGARAGVADLDGDTHDGGRAGGGRPGLPRRLGRYHVLERLGAGGMGVVFAAYDPDLDRRVAVKLLHGRGGHESQVRLLREAQALARLSHPNVVQIHDASVVGEQVFIAMEFVRGQDLRTWLSAQERSDSEVVRVFLEAGRGLAAAHAVGLVHRDFKPENVLVGADGRVRVADFGLARAGGEDGGVAAGPAGAASTGPLEVSLTATGALLGTPAYMSPEQHCGLRADARSDQFSFCVALWEALYGQRPFAGGSPAELVLAVQSGAIRPPPADSRAPRRLAEVLRRGLRPRPEERYPDMNAVLAALARDPARARRRWLAGAALVAMSAGTAFFVADRRAAEANACSGGPAALADAWGPERRAAALAALAPADPELGARVLAGLDGYAARWSVAHRDACLDHRRGEISAALFDARVRCLERRRLALGSAAAVVAAGVPDPAGLVARLPGLGACADPDLATSEATFPEDPVLTSSIRDLEARLIDARARFHAGDVANARTAVAAVVATARDRGFRSLLAEAALLLAELHEVLNDPEAGGEAAAEAAEHALATRRDDLAAEALARRVFFDGLRSQVDQALAAAPIARGLAERLPAPEAALARLDHNLGFIHFYIRRDAEAARPHFERAAAALARAPEDDPIEQAHFWINLAVADRSPAARERAFERAAALLEGQLGERHLRTLELRASRGLHAADAATGAAILGEVCPQIAALYPDEFRPCGYCYYNLGHFYGTLAERDRAVEAFARVDACLERGELDEDGADQRMMLRDRAAAFAALLRGQALAALAHADAAYAVGEPHRSMWWVQAELAELDLARGKALLAMDRVDEGRAALARAIPVFEDMTRTRVEVLDTIWLAEARALLAAPVAQP